MKEGNKSDKIDARSLAELLRLHHLNPVYHGEHGLRTLKELVRSYLTITKDLGRVMTRVKALYRSSAIPLYRQATYAPRHRAEWLAKINELGVRRRAEFASNGIQSSPAGVWLAANRFRKATVGNFENKQATENGDRDLELSSFPKK